MRGNEDVIMFYKLILLMLFMLSAISVQAAKQQITPIPIPNSGFEAGAEGWNLPSNAAIVVDQAHTGKKSVRLTVEDPMKDGVYITRMIPVIGGASYVARCMVKTAGVTKKQGKMASVGAGLIIEWADKNGGWYASGDYAAGLYGDNGWTVQEAKNLRAPDKAAFAIFYLALRDAGTAWFDDIELERVDLNLTPLSPASGSTLHSNRPLLSWKDDPQVTGYTVEISRDMAFPSSDTIRLMTDQSSIRPPKPLSAGRWYWRISAPGYSMVTSWTFEQTAPLSEDTTPPTIEALPIRVIRANEAVHVRVQGDKDERGQLKVRAVLYKKIIKTTTRSTGQRSVDAVLSAHWNPGINWVTITATDAAGNRDTQTLLVLYRPMPAHPVTISKAGAYVDAGKLIFPLGIYEVSTSAMPIVKKAGLELVHSYRFEESTDDAPARTYLNAAANAGLRVFIGFDRGANSGQGLIQGNIEHVIERVAALCDNPGLFCWYLFDEPEQAFQFISPRGLIAYGNLIRRLDPYHPVVVVTFGPAMSAYRPSYDTHWTEAYDTPATDVKVINSQRDRLPAQTPITMIAHCYDPNQLAELRKGKPVDTINFKPDGAWMRAAAFSGVTQRVNGLIWWWYADGSKEWATVASVPEAWNGLSNVFAQLHTLEPVLVNRIKPETGSININGGKLHWWRKKIGRETTLIAVNTTEMQIQVTLAVTGNGKTAVMFEDRMVQRENGKLTDSFLRYDVHVYRYTN